MERCERMDRYCSTERQRGRVPAKANIALLRATFNISSEISIPCEVEGYPIPSVVWYKENHQLEAGERVDLKDPHQLIIKRANTSDSGTYRCEARNPYGNSSSSIEILVEGIYVHPNCVDNSFFANCAMILKARYCTNKYYAKFCCRSCTIDGQITSRGPHFDV
ncbi:hypothetical protein J437_LFUL013848 [Ladona fulva]|uniref:Papilin n=1 Tax=Ladona fulva TaxID=123851 RepID=A0A8K0KG61_LADFU|nr:hypothetical protein J437_LFUL013848 [Ladona fulva]